MTQKLPKAPEGFDVVAWVTNKLDCCVGKVIEEYSATFKDYKITNLVVHESMVKDVMNYVPKAVICFRTGGGDDAKHIDDVIRVVSTLRSLRVKTFYYTDDLIFGANNWAPMKVLNVCEEVIVSSPTLRDYLRSIGSNAPIHILETHMYIKAFDEVPPNTLSLNHNKVKVMWTSSGRIGIRMLNEVLDRMDKEPERFSNIQMVMVAGGIAQVRSTVNHFRNVDKVYMEWMDKTDFYSICKACDIIISCGEQGDLDYFLPATFQKPWLDSKSAVKYCIAGASRIPIISQPLAMYAKAIKNGETGYIANTPEEFVQLIDTLSHDADLRQTIGNAARADIEENYDIVKRTKQFIDILTTQKPLVVEPSIVGEALKVCWIPPIAGGPLSFVNTLSKHLPTLSRGRWTVASTEIPEKVDAVILPAFLGYKEMLDIKVKNPTCKVISRVDGIPVDFTGNLAFESIELMKRIMNEADFIVWQSRHCRTLWKEYVNTDRGMIIHNGVDLDVFKREGETYNFPGGADNILCLNYSTFPHKRRDILDQIALSNPSMNFHVVGHYISAINPDMEKEHWRQFPNVQYLGPILNNPPAIASLMRGATCLLFTSEMEGSPNTVLEAMACGCPIIYNAKADIVPEILGRVLAQGFTDPAEFTSLVPNITDFLVRKKLATKLEVVAESYSAEVCINKYLRVLDGKITMQPNQSR